MVLGEQKSDWTPMVDALNGQLPVVFFNGTHDPQVPMETLDEFQQDHDWIDYRIYEDCGQLIFFRHCRLCWMRRKSTSFVNFYPMWGMTLSADCC